MQACGIVWILCPLVVLVFSCSVGKVRGVWSLGGGIGNFHPSHNGVCWREIGVLA